MKKVFLLSLLIVIILTTTACKRESVETIGIRGQIVEVHLDEENLLIHSILVEGEVEEDTLYDSANVSITEDTRIVKDGQELAVESLEEGLMVEVIFHGPVAESYPVQGVAKEITIIEE